MTEQLESKEVYVGGFEGTAEHIRAFEALLGSFDSTIGRASAICQKADPESQTAQAAWDSMRDLIHARTLLDPDDPDTLELGHLYLKQVKALLARDNG